MGANWLNQLGGVLQQYASGEGPQPAQVEQHFDQVASSAPKSSIADALSAAFRSAETPPFGEMLGKLFNHSNPGQKAGLLNALLGSGSGGVASSIAGALGVGAGGPMPVTPEQAQNIPAADVQRAVAQAGERDPSIIDRASQFYAQHPDVVKMLGAAALGAMMSHLATRSR
ncbi:MAG TPA: hypothetical protein VFA04_18895 [Bryobacteraceae bacterium]|jgi:hypothetical protein|nr:hypothetical protein [Bryobacteraceae bacterium]